ncbi:MAG: hypothetical protein AAFO06_22455 [Cyanobacteria bacterium J06597_16]
MTGQANEATAAVFSSLFGVVNVWAVFGGIFWGVFAAVGLAVARCFSDRT